MFKNLEMKEMVEVNGGGIEPSTLVAYGVGATAAVVGHFVAPALGVAIAVLAVPTYVEANTPRPARTNTRGGNTYSVPAYNGNPWD